MAAERGDGDDEGPRAPEPETHDEEGPARRAARQRHLRAARDFFETAPPFRVQSELDGTVSLCRKRYDYWPNRPPPRSGNASPSTKALKKPSSACGT